MEQELAEIFDDFYDGEDNLPTELLLDPYHPSNDKFYESIKSIQRLVNAITHGWPQSKTEALRLVHQGMNDTQVGKRLKIGSQTIGRYRKSQQGKDLLQLYRHLQQLRDGPQLDHKKSFLWRIAVDNEENRPRISIAAIQEMNKMSGSYAEQNAASNVFNIQINSELLPRGQLDELPPVHVIEHKKDLPDAD